MIDKFIYTKTIEIKNRKECDEIFFKIIQEFKIKYNKALVEINKTEDGYILFDFNDYIIKRDININFDDYQLTIILICNTNIQDFNEKVEFINEYIL
ncbi:hypothetical protein EJM73_08610 [Clostridium botulinum]|uniref:hypothetical protein n=1 Tax=Clostridium botulinum TaxID=1491 RepID=UPI001375F1E1|nr:hypothetical protein [Clostridium botulinum]NCI19685.1 hypothetical protein [Clostridium botulinum]NCI35723.1 hypothetical protein [Clostridium botulinum]NCI71580.1 hypothetical protein [Clostridium botulinum]NDI38772.1 hypothetical protein [Clostridium botulinum]